MLPEVTYKRTVTFGHPLHWANFWINVKRVNKVKMEEKQALVFDFANLHAEMMNSKFPFMPTEIRLSEIREKVRDYKVAFDYFFEVVKLGHYIENKEIIELTTIVPKVLKYDTKAFIKDFEYKLPSIERLDYVESKPLITNFDLAQTLNIIQKKNRYEFIPAVKWLHKNQDTVFLFAPCGKLQLRDTSIWPIKGIETWPVWLRDIIFVGSIDIDSAYVQFLLSVLGKIQSEDLISMLYPNIYSLLHNKEEIRRKLCESILEIEYNELNKKFIKRIIMAIANGSKISEDLLNYDFTKSSATTMIKEKQPDRKLYSKIGKEFNVITNEFVSAKKVIVKSMAEQTHQSTKNIFKLYFSWERDCRYKIWESIGRQGIMVHDGIEGVDSASVDRIPELMTSLDLLLSN